MSIRILKFWANMGTWLYWLLAIIMMTATHYNHHDRDEDNDYFALNVYWPGEGRCRRGEWGRKSIVLSDYHRNCCHHPWWAIMQNNFSTAPKVSSKKRQTILFWFGLADISLAMTSWRYSSKTWELLNLTLRIFYMPELWKLTMNFYSTRKNLIYQYAIYLLSPEY